MRPAAYPKQTEERYRAQTRLQLGNIVGFMAAMGARFLLGAVTALVIVS